MAIGAAPVPGARSSVTTFGAYTSDKPTDMVDQFRPVLNLLEWKLSGTLRRPVEIKMQIAPTYEQGVADLVEGRVDIARLGPASAAKWSTSL